MLRTPPRVVDRRPTWRLWLALGLIGLAAVFVGRPAYHIARSAIVNAPRETPIPAGFTDDASRLNRTPVAALVRVDADSAGAEAQLAALLRRAAQEKVKVAIAGARHSMGGHTIAPNGVVIDMTTFRGMSLTAEGTLRVRGGSRWAEVIPFLDSSGRSLRVMQSNNSFTVGGSLSANAHGWQHDHAPIASTVRAMRVMTADGVVHRTSRAENPELFRLVLGGYGLFGIILDAELETLPNERYRMRRYETTSAAFEKTYALRAGGHRSVGMAYGRLSISPSSFLRDATLTVFVRDTTDHRKLPPVTDPGLLRVKRAVLRGSERSEYGKSLRWTLERWLGELPGSSRFTRNQLLHEPAEFFANTSDSTTDVLHEYFVPMGQLESFVARIRPILQRPGSDLLNVTIRSVYPDADGYLAYAREPVWGLVMLFTQERSPAGEVQMRTLTRELVDAALAVRGTYYLPYRLHATSSQFRRAYPMADRFFELKRRYDPAEIFSNAFYQAYAK
jgi:FAD/FMN-containing dehydrogenase